MSFYIINKINEIIGTTRYYSFDENEHSVKKVIHLNNWNYNIFL